MKITAILICALLLFNQTASALVTLQKHSKTNNFIVFDDPSLIAFAEFHPATENEVERYELVNSSEQSIGSVEIRSQLTYPLILRNTDTTAEKIEIHKIQDPRSGQIYISVQGENRKGINLHTSVDPYDSFKENEIAKVRMVTDPKQALYLFYSPHNELLAKMQFVRDANIKWRILPMTHSPWISRALIAIALGEDQLDTVLNRPESRKSKFLYYATGIGLFVVFRSLLIQYSPI